MPEIKEALQKILSPDRVASDPASRLLYSRDMMSGGLLESKAQVDSHLPDLVCWPESTREVAAILKIAHRRNIPVVPFGAGSGVSGGTVPVGGGIMLDLKRMSRIEKIEKIGGGRFFVTARSGIIGQHLERDLNTQGFTLGHFPSSILCATLGGYLACRSAGQLSSKYGKIEDMVDEIETVLANGTIVGFGRRLKKYREIRPVDLFVGSEGCLGVITRSRLRIYPLPPVTRYRGVRFGRLTGALKAMREIMQSGLRPAVVRLYDPLDTMLLSHGYRKEPAGLAKILRGLASKIPVPSAMKDLAEGHFKLLLRYPSLLQAITQQLSSEVLLILSFEGDSKTSLADEQTALSICRKQGGRDQGEHPGLHWRDHRYSVSFKMPKLFEQDCFVDTIEVATTWSRLLPLYDAIRKVLTSQALVLAHFSHAYPEGCSIYFTVVARGISPVEDLKRYNHLWNDAMETCLAQGATISHHHGIGLLKAKYLPRELGPAMDFFREIKKRLDPRNIMNPGKMGL